MSRGEAWVDDAAATPPALHHRTPLELHRPGNGWIGPFSSTSLTPSIGSQISLLKSMARPQELESAGDIEATVEAVDGQVGARGCRGAVPGAAPPALARLQQLVGVLLAARPAPEPGPPLSTLLQERFRSFGAVGTAEGCWDLELSKAAAEGPPRLVVALSAGCCSVGGTADQLVPRRYGPQGSVLFVRFYEGPASGVDRKCVACGVGALEWWSEVHGLSHNKNMYVCTHTDTHARTHTHTHIYTHAHTDAMYTHTQSHARTHAHMHALTHTNSLPLLHTQGRRPP